jgi:hypothetical protein
VEEEEKSFTNKITDLQHPSRETTQIQSMQDLNNWK